MADDRGALAHYRKQRALLLKQIDDDQRGYQPLGEFDATTRPVDIARRLRKRLEQLENLIAAYEKKNAQRT
jgi:hypothetical protein